MKRIIDKIIEGNFRCEMKEKDLRDSARYFSQFAVCVDVSNIIEYMLSELSKRYNPEDTGAVATELERLGSLTPCKLPFEVMCLESNIQCYNNQDEPYDSPGRAATLLIEPREKPNEISALHFLQIPYHPINLFAVTSWFGDNEKITRTTIHQDFDKETVNRISYYELTNITSVLFFHCRNVNLVVSERRAKRSKVFERKNSVPLPAVHVIEIHKKMEQYQHQGKIRSLGSVASAQVVRGHFKSYGPFNKLLGKHEGTFFWQSHVRGFSGQQPNPAQYRVWPPSPRHLPACNISKLVN